MQPDIPVFNIKTHAGLLLFLDLMEPIFKQTSHDALAYHCFLSFCKREIHMWILKIEFMQVEDCQSTFQTWDSHVNSCFALV